MPRLRDVHRHATHGALRRTLRLSRLWGARGAGFPQRSLHRWHGPRAAHGPFHQRKGAARAKAGRLGAWSGLFVLQRWREKGPIDPGAARWVQEFPRSPAVDDQSLGAGQSEKPVRAFAVRIWLPRSRIAISSGGYACSNATSRRSATGPFEPFGPAVAFCRAGAALAV